MVGAATRGSGVEAVRIAITGHSGRPSRRVDSAVMKSTITVTGLHRGDTWVYGVHCWKCDWRVAPSRDDADRTCWNQAMEAAQRHWWAKHKTDRESMR